MPRKRPFSGLFTRNHQHDSEKNFRAPISIPIRDPLPLDRERPSVAQLPDHIVQLILDFLQHLCPKDVLTVALLSSFLYKQARYVQHRVVHIDLDKSRYIHDRLGLIMYGGLLPAIRVLEVSGQDFDELQKEEGEGILTRLANMLSGMTGLRDLSWQIGRTTGERSFTEKEITAMPIPIPILESLPPGVQLHTSIFCKESERSHDQAREFLDRLANNQHLHTLSIKVSFIQEWDCLKTMKALKKVLLSCPNLTRLPLLDVWYRRQGCIGYGPLPGSPYCGLGLSDGERPLALEELGLRDYPWGYSGIHGYRGKDIEWDYWAEIFDWSRLTRLNDMPSNILSIMAPKMTGLKELMLESYHPQKEIFNKIISPLNTLSILSWYSVENSPELISQYGATLQKLKIHQREHWEKREYDSFIPTPDLIQLSNGLPHLKELAIDITRVENTGQWPYEVLDVIARFPSLRIIELWFPLGQTPPAPIPSLTIFSARHLFHYLRKRNGNLQRLILHLGAPSPGILYLFGCPVDREPSWAMHTSVTFVCNMAYDVGGEEGNVSVTCLDLSSDMNSQLHYLAQQADRDWADPRELDVDGLRLKAALDGPLTMDEWEGWLDGQRARRHKSYREQNTVLKRLVTGPFKRALK